MKQKVEDSNTQRASLCHSTSVNENLFRIWEKKRLVSIFHMLISRYGDAHTDIQ